MLCFKFTKPDDICADLCALYKAYRWRWEALQTFGNQIKLSVVQVLGKGNLDQNYIAPGGRITACVIIALSFYVSRSLGLLKRTA